MAIERQPLYEQVEHAIEEGIRTEEWPAGSVLPSETALAERFGVSVCTVRKALDALAQKNHVEKRHGIGTFVTSYSSRGYWNRFQRYQMLDGTLPRWSDRIVTCERRRPSERVLKALGLTELSKALPEDGLLWRLERAWHLTAVPWERTSYGFIRNTSGSFAPMPSSTDPKEVFTPFSSVLSALW